VTEPTHNRDATFCYSAYIPIEMSDLSAIAEHSIDTASGPAPHGRAISGASVQKIDGYTDRASPAGCPSEGQSRTNRIRYATCQPSVHCQLLSVIVILHIANTFALLHRCCTDKADRRPRSDLCASLGSVVQCFRPALVISTCAATPDHTSVRISCTGCLLSGFTTCPAACRA
jgi:hypothetical protein